MNILVIGAGGREHALCWKLRQGQSVDRLYCAPGNGGTLQVAENVDIDVSNHHKVKDFCKDKKIDLVVVGPESPLSQGITDVLEPEGIIVFGPSYAASRMESSKIFAKQLMGSCSIPTAAFRIFDDIEKAEEYIKDKGAPLVVKADGLAAGKGVIVASTEEEAIAAAREMLVDKKFGSAGKRIIVEECLQGEEVSILVVTDGETILPLASSQDHKRVFDGDKGPNTGGMGAYSPAPVVSEELFKEVIETIVEPTIKGLKEEMVPYKGVLYTGIMLTEDGPKVLEYNVRFGDPETQAILPRIKSDLAEVLMAAGKGELGCKTIEWDERECVCVVLAAGGYPGSYEKGKRITGIEDAQEEGAVIFHAGTKWENGHLLTNGGRVLNVTGMGNNIEEAVSNTYKAVSKIQFDGMHYRRDIAYRAIKRIKR